MKVKLSIICVFLFCCHWTFAQTDSSTSSQTPPLVSAVDEQNQRLKLNKIINPEYGQNKIVIDDKRLSYPEAPPIDKKQRKLLQPDEQLAAKYVTFLQQTHTGLIKLFPNVGCEENSRILRVDADCLKWIPHSAFYSFRKHEYVGDIFADIAYQDATFIGAGFLSQGILTVLGDIPVENVSLSTEGMDFLVHYQPATQNSEAQKQFQEISKGVVRGKYVYGKALSAVENLTYAGRFIAYKGKSPAVGSRTKGNLLAGDKRLDIIVAFRIVGTNDDGSIFLLWKELSRNEAPTVVFPKKKKNK